MAEASELLISPTASAQAIENALAAVIRDGKSADFAKAFGHRRLLKALAQGTLSEQAQELADELLSATDGGVANSLANGMDFSEVLHREELHPDVRVDCSTPSVWWPGKDEAEEANTAAMLKLRLPMPGGGWIAFAPTSSQAYCFDAAGAVVPPVVGTAPVLTLDNPSRRARLGSEIECKVWPAAVMMSRWLARHPFLVRGRRVLELGSGVGTAGIAAAACGARRVFLTDINGAALASARRNCEKNGDAVRHATAVGYLDWGDPPAPSVEDEGDEGAGNEGAGGDSVGSGAGNGPESNTESAEAMLASGRPFDVLLAADIVNDRGLSELVYAMIERYLGAEGAFIMICPKSRHRFQIDRLRSLLTESVDLEVAVGEAPPVLAAGLEEAEVVEHEIIIAQWR